MGEKIVLFKSPVVVGLAGALPEGVNNLIWGFVGFQSRAGELIKQRFRQHMEGIMSREERFAEVVLWEVRCRITRHIFNLFLRLKGSKKPTQRRDEFLKLPIWVQKHLLRYRGLFPKTFKFLNQRIAE